VNRPWEAVDHELATSMSDYWVSFVKTGNPNHNKALKWPLFNAKEKLTMYFDVKNKVNEMEDLERLNYLFKSMTANK
jgi:para-nitrobenzyl esterase